MKYRFSELIDIPRLQRLTSLFYNATGIPASVVDLDGTVLTDAGRSTVCTEYHRVNPETQKRCIESDTAIASHLQANEKYTVYKCKNGLIDAAAPIFIEGRHVANFFAGRFLLDAPDAAFFLRQAAEFGFPEAAYMKAVAEIPVIDEKKLISFLDYLAELAGLAGELGLSRLSQVEAERSLADMRKLLEGEKMEAMEALAGNIAHDLNNILAAVVGFSEIAMRKVPEGPARRYIQRIYEAGVRGREAVKAMLSSTSSNLYRPKTGTHRARAVEEEQVPTGQERILLVDDEEALAEMGEELLTDLGYRVISKTSSTEALDLVRRDPSQFDLVITDQTMPGMTGLELTEEILSIRPDMPVILCSGFGHLVDADTARAARIRTFVMKPLTKGETARMIRKVLDKDSR